MDLADTSFPSRSLPRSRLDQLRLDQLSHSFGSKRAAREPIPVLRERTGISINRDPVGHKDIPYLR